MLGGSGQPPEDPGRGRSRSQDRNRHLLREGDKKTAGLYLTIFKPYFSLSDPMAGGRLATSTANISPHHGCQGKKANIFKLFSTVMTIMKKIHGVEEKPFTSSLH
jgi:hypothetical protein